MGSGECQETSCWAFSRISADALRGFENGFYLRQKVGQVIVFKRAAGRIVPHLPRKLPVQLQVPGCLLEFSCSAM